MNLTTTIKNNLTIFLFFTLFSYAQVQRGNTIEGENIFDGDGFSVALSNDGNRIVIGSPTSDGIDVFGSGHAGVFENQDGDWVQIGSDIRGETEFENFGFSVAISADGSTIAVATVSHTVNGMMSAGRIKIFQYQNDDWEQIGNDIEGELTAEQTGWKVDLSDQGDIVAVSSPGFHFSGQIAARGRVRVYKNEMDSWVQMGDDIIGDGTQDLLGRGLVISADGNIVAVGAHMNSNANGVSGQVKVFRFESENWIQIGANIIGEFTGDDFGFNVTISSDGNTVAAGSSSNDTNGDNTGNVRIFENQGDEWVQMGNTIYGDQTNASFGRDISISSNGNIIGIPASGYNSDNGVAAGLVRVYQYLEGIWNQIGVDILGEEEMDQSGFSIAISGSGELIAIGAPYHEAIPGSATTGQVRVFDMSDVVTLSVNEVSLDNSFVLYPNPTRDMVNVLFDGDETLKQIIIFNQLGQFIEFKHKTTFSVKNLTAGCYFLQIETNKGSSIKKLIVK
jgi:hypothetical protein